MRDSQELGPTELIEIMRKKSSIRDQAFKDLVSSLRVLCTGSDDDHKWVEKLKGTDVTKCIESDVFGPALFEDIMTDIEKSDYETTLKENLLKVAENGSEKSRCRFVYDSDGQLSVSFLECSVYTVHEQKILAFAALNWTTKLPLIPCKVLWIFPWHRKCCMTVKEQKMVKTWCWQEIYDHVAAKCGIE